MNPSKLKEKLPSARNVPLYSSMSNKTKVFIQKICYRKTASVDMTKHGFVNDSKINPVNLMLKPLRHQLDKIWGKQIPSSAKSTPSRRGSVKQKARAPSKKNEKHAKKSKHKIKKSLKIKIPKSKI